MSSGGHTFKHSNFIIQLSFDILYFFYSNTVYGSHANRTSPRYPIPYALHPLFTSGSHVHMHTHTHIHLTQTTHCNRVVIYSTGNDTAALREVLK
jgi:hypothetical protein